MKEIHYIRVLWGLHRAGLQCKLSPGRIKTISQTRISTDSCQGLLIWEKRRKFVCAVLVSFSSYINHSLKFWCVSNHQHAWTVFDKRGNELQLCSPYSRWFSSATREQPELFAYKSWAFGIFATAREKGKERQIPHKLVFQPHCRRFTLSTAWQAIPARQLGVCVLVCRFSTDSLFYDKLQILYSGQSPAFERLSEVLGWQQWLQFDPSHCEFHFVERETDLSWRPLQSSWPDIHRECFLWQSTSSLSADRLLPL